MVPRYSQAVDQVTAQNTQAAHAEAQPGTSANWDGRTGVAVHNARRHEAFHPTPISRNCLGACFVTYRDIPTLSIPFCYTAAVITNKLTQTA